MSRIAIFAGHSGGHLFPAAAFAESLRQRTPQSWIGLVTSRKALPLVSKLPAGVFDRVDYFPEFPFSWKLDLRSAVFFIEFLKSFVLAFSYLRKNQIRLCAGFGSYVSYPGVLTAGFLKIPTLIHEQNLIPGKATQRLVNRADAVAVSFEETFKKRNLKRRIVTGLPLRRQLVESAAAAQGRRHSEVPDPSPSQKELQQALSLRVPQPPGGLQKALSGTKQSRRLGTGSTISEIASGTSYPRNDPGADVFRILVMGGSQGAHRLNEAVLESFSRFLPEEKKKIAVKHLTGREDFGWVSQKYAQIGIQHEIFPFCETMEQLYPKADMAITRAGANTLFELALFKLPAVVVPYPHAEAHQRANAEYFASRGAVILKEENLLTGHWLGGQILELKKNPERLQAMSRAMAEFSEPDAALRLAEAAADLLERKTDACH